MRLMSAPSEPVQVWHYDGESGIRRAPVLVSAGDAFLLVEHEREHGPFCYADLIAGGRIAGEMQYSLRNRPGWRIGFPADPPANIARLLPHRRHYGGVIDRLGLWPAAIGFGVLSAIGLYGLMNTPSMLVRFIPQSAEARLGKLMVGDFGGRTCSTPGGDAALDALSSRLGGAEGATVRVVDVPIVNAVTLPGGHILLFRGLIAQAESPDEVAGILGHELGHVEHRHVLQSLLRQFGLSMVLGGLDSNVGGYTNVLLSATYSRAAEADADSYAIAQLNRAHVSPLGAASFFERLSRGELKTAGAAKLMNYVASHPLSADRQKRFEASPHSGTTPALNARQWKALRAICEDRPKQSFRF